MVLSQRAPIDGTWCPAQVLPAEEDAAAAQLAAPRCPDGGAGMACGAAAASTAAGQTTPPVAAALAAPIAADLVFGPATDAAAATASVAAAAAAAAPAAVAAATFAPQAAEAAVAEAGASPGESPHARLARLDPTCAARVHPRNARRVARYLEVLESTGVRPSQLFRARAALGADLRYRCLFLWVDADVDALAPALAARCAMWRALHSGSARPAHRMRHACSSALLMMAACRHQRAL